MNNAEDWSKTNEVERALIVLASFDVWTLEEAAYLSAGILPPKYKKEQQDMLARRLFAELALRKLESAVKRVEGRLSLMFSGTGGLNVEIRAVDEKGRFNADELLGFMCHMFSDKSMAPLVGYRKRGRDENDLESLREFEFSQRPRTAPGERKAGLLLSNGEVWESEEFENVEEVIRKYWIPWRKGETKKIPTNSVVANFLHKEKGMPERNALLWARVLRPKNLPSRVRGDCLITE